MSFEVLEEKDVSLKEKFRRSISSIGFSGNFSDPEKAVVNGLKPILFIGKFLGLLPRSDILSLQASHGKGKQKSHLQVIYTITLASFFFTNALFQTLTNIRRFKDASTVGEKLHELVLPTYTFTLFFLYVYFLFNTKKLTVIILKLLTLVGSNLDVMGKDETTRTSEFATYPKFCVISLVFIMAYGISENAAFDIQNIGGADKQFGSTLQRFYSQNFNHWNNYVSYNPILTLLFIVLVKCGTYAWIFGDILVIVVVKVIREKLYNLKIRMNNSLSPTPFVINSILKPIEKRRENGRKICQFSLEEARQQYMRLAGLVTEIEGFISPLMLSCYGLNVYLIIINLFYWIAPNATFSDEQTFYSYFAFAHFSFRVFSVTYFVADVYHVSSSIMSTLQKCPNYMYTLPIERLERSILWNPCGITLFGTFMITRKFLISIISFIFTAEIVLLQTTGR